MNIQYYLNRVLARLTFLCGRFGLLPAAENPIPQPQGASAGWANRCAVPIYRDVELAATLSLPLFACRTSRLSTGYCGNFSKAMPKLL